MSSTPYRVNNVDRIFVEDAASQLGYQGFVYTVQPTDGDDFFVNLPVARTDANYTVTANVSKAAVVTTVSMPNDAPGDRTATRFRVYAQFPLTSGDQIEFNVFTKS